MSGGAADPLSAGAPLRLGAGVLGAAAGARAPGRPAPSHVPPPAGGRRAGHGGHILQSGRRLPARLAEEHGAARPGTDPAGRLTSQSSVTKSSLYLGVRTGKLEQKM